MKKRKTEIKKRAPVVLRPASREEAGFFYSERDESKDKDLGTVGHVRMDFGHGGRKFYHTWWPHNRDLFNTPEFKAELQTVVDALRANGPLKDLSAMSAYCWENGGAIAEDGRIYGYIAETERYRFCLRCTPAPGEYQGYLYCYDLRQQAMAQRDKIVGRIAFAVGDPYDIADPKQYLQIVRQELPYRDVTGFRYETLMDDPQIRKAVDDILLDFAGEENPRRACNYGLTETGRKAMKDAADPSIPHSYAWFVMTDCNTSDEQVHRDLTLEEAIQTYLESDRQEKRIGVTKDGVATVDMARSLDGEQQFFGDYQRLDSFKSDPEIAAAAETLQMELEQNTPQQGMTMEGGLAFE